MREEKSPQTDTISIKIPVNSKKKYWPLNVHQYQQKTNIHLSASLITEHEKAGPWHMRCGNPGPSYAQIRPILCTDTSKSSTTALELCTTST